MIKRFLKPVLILVFGSILFWAPAQDMLSGGRVTGNFQMDAQIYNPDDALGITDSSLNYKKYGMNGFANFIYSNQNFSAGLRAEGFMNPMLGFDPRYEGIGIPYWFMKYKLSKFEVTAGHFYEQFGSGMILRSYEEWTLGYDNNLYGFNAKFEPFAGVRLTGLTGVHRYFWEPYKKDDRGMVRGADAEIYLNEAFSTLENADLKVTLGASFVSKYEKVPNMTFSRDSAYFTINEFGDTTQWIHKETYKYNLPYNVGSWAARTNLSYKNVNLYAEYARKGNDPNATNNYIYHKGQGLYATLTYSTKGLGIYLATKWIDNMGYKSKLTEKGVPPMLDINYLPAISKEHVYSLATIYPYATKPNGEAGIQAQVDATIPTKVNGKYNTTVSLNVSLANAIKKEQAAGIPLDSTGTEGYTAQFLSFGDLKYYRDINFQIDQKFNKKFSAKAAGFFQLYNKHVIEDDIFDDENMVNAVIAVLDMTYKFTPARSLRVEAEGLWTKEDKGDWAALTLEYNISPHWFFSVMDEFNYGNPDDDMQLHYYNLSFGYTEKSNRISVRYGRQREGLLCVGGVCRYVPASTGLTITLTSSF